MCCFLVLNCTNIRNWLIMWTKYIYEQNVTAAFENLYVEFTIQLKHIGFCVFESWHGFHSCGKIMVTVCVECF